MANAWITHVKKYAKDNNLSYKEALSKASPSYKKGSGVCMSKNTRVAPYKVEDEGESPFSPRNRNVVFVRPLEKPKKKKNTHTMPDGTIMKGKTHKGKGNIIASCVADNERANELMIAEADRVLLERRIRELEEERRRQRQMSKTKSKSSSKHF